MQCLGGPINSFFPGHLGSCRPKLSRYTGFPLPIASPFFEARSGFLKARDRGFAASHDVPPNRNPGGRTTLTVINEAFHASLPEIHSVLRNGNRVVRWAAAKQDCDLLRHPGNQFAIQLTAL